MSEAKWYILHTFSGYENKVADNIKKVVENRHLEHLIEEVMVPTETVTEEHDGKTRTYQSKIYPSYVYVKMVMTDESWYICRNTRGCTGFVGPREIDEAAGTAVVAVSMFGRETPATLDLSLIQKIN